MYLAKFSDKLMHICDNIFNSNHATCHICWQKLLLSLSLLLLLWSGVSLKIRQKLICCIICCIIIMMIIAVLLLLLLSALSVTRQGPKLSFVPRQMRNNSLKCK